MLPNFPDNYIKQMSCIWHPGSIISKFLPSRKYLVLISKYPSESLVDLFGQLYKQLNCFNLPSRNIEHLAMKSVTIPTMHQDASVVQHAM
jgi:hypothetical protein